MSPRVILGETLYNTQETMKLLSISRPTLLGYIKSNKIKSQRIGRSLYFSEKNIKHFLHGEPAEGETTPST